jgi:small ligand-binding sensory domain FIST
MIAGTGFAASPEARPELAAHAVRMALARCGAEVASSIILLLTPHFARAPQAALTAAARAGNCLQIAGCTTPGVFTEQAWTLDQPAAAALVLGGGLRLAAPLDDAPRLSLAMPDALDAAWLRTGQPRFGALATGDEHHAVSAVWNHGKWQVEGRCEAGLAGGQFELAVSRGMQAISGALEVADADGYELLLLGDERPLDTLVRQLPPELRDADNRPDLGAGLFFAAVIDPALGLERSLAEGRYSLVPIVATNGGDGTVTLGAALDPGTTLFWALRHPLAAEMELRRGVMLLQEQHTGQTPAFALLFSCLGRGPYFYGGADHDLGVLIDRYPGMPVLGGYCGGEIAPLPGGNSIISYSAVAALAYPDPAHVQSEP